MPNSLPTATHLLHEMYTLQHEFQCAYLKKRKPEEPTLLLGKYSGLSKELTIYWWSCATIELEELVERFEPYFSITDSQERKNEQHEIYVEYIDIFHFLMNICLYTGVAQIAENDIHEIYPVVTEVPFEERLKTAQEQLAGPWLAVSRHAGQIMMKSPFKNWKAYSALELTTLQGASTQLAQQMFVAFFEIGAILGISVEEFSTLYRNKLSTNYNRQLPSGKYSE